MVPWLDRIFTSFPSSAYPPHPKRERQRLELRIPEQKKTDVEFDTKLFSLQGFSLNSNKNMNNNKRSKEKRLSYLKVTARDPSETQNRHSLFLFLFLNICWRKMEFIWSLGMLLQMILSLEDKWVQRACLADWRTWYQDAIKYVNMNICFWKESLWLWNPQKSLRKWCKPLENCVDIQHIVTALSSSSLTSRVFALLSTPQWILSQHSIPIL